ncbi:MAG TPA: BlaI/MecI/CopY family transcriptional regulator [Oculatellaceae cyanobacterium]
MRLHDENASFRFNQTGLRKFLGDLECEIMEIVWKKASPSVTVREIFDVLKNERQIAYTTVMTTMARLAEKGILRLTDKSGLANNYTPLESKQEFVTNAVARVLDIFTKEFPKESALFFEKYNGRKTEKRPTTTKKK